MVRRRQVGLNRTPDFARRRRRRICVARQLEIRAGGESSRLRAFTVCEFPPSGRACDNVEIYSATP